MRDFGISPSDLVASLWSNYSLTAELVKREIIGRYRGSMLGILWSFFNPLFLLVVYTFVFGVIFKSRWNPGSDSKTEFALVLFAGLLIFNLFAECVNRAPGLVLANPNYVKKVVFPLEILPWIAIGSAFFHTLISLVVWLIFYLAFFGLPHPTALLLPIILVPLVLLTMGISWFLASLGVYLRDVSQFIGIVTTVLMFLSPTFYPLSAIPPEYRPFLMLNPVTPAIEIARDLLVWGRLPNLFALGAYYMSAVVVAWLGFAWFQKTRRGFADVL